MATSRMANAPPMISRPHVDTEGTGAGVGVAVGTGVGVGVAVGSGVGVGVAVGTGVGVGVGVGVSISATSDRPVSRWSSERT